jgi:hypothetical protein
MRRTILICSALCALMGLWATPLSPVAAASPATRPAASRATHRPIPPGWTVVTPDDLQSTARRNGAARTGRVSSKTGAASTQAGAYYIYSWANLKYVATERDYPGGSKGMLRARSLTIGPWERYSFLGTDHGTFLILADANTLYVSAELNYGGEDWAMLRARAWPAGPWEDFRLLYNSSNNTHALQSVANGYYVSSEQGATGGRWGMLRARAVVIGPWERFEVGWI